MAIVGTLTLNEMLILEVDTNPSVEGLSAPSGSIAVMTDGSGTFQKGEGGDFDWVNHVSVEAAARSAEDLTFLKTNGSRAMTGPLTRPKDITVPNYSVATTNGNLFLTNLSNTVQFITETIPVSGYSVSLPDATTLPNGWNFEIYNRTSNPITFKFNDGTVIGTLSKEAVSSLILQDNSTQKGIWSPFTVEIAQQAAGVINYALEQSTQFSTTSPTDVQITLFTLIPQSGQYFINLNMTVACTGNNATNYVTIYKNGIAQTGSERSSLSSGNNTSFILSTGCVVSVNGTDEIRVYVRTVPASGAAPTLYINNRSIIALRLGTG